MGSHARADIAYGIPLGNEETLDVTDEEWEEICEAWSDDEYAKLGFEVVSHGNTQGGYTDHFIAMPGTRTHVYAWEPRRYYSKDFNLPPTDKLLEFDKVIRKYGLDPKDAGWYVMTDFG